MRNFEEKLDAYAQLAIEIGINLQKGQQLVVSAPVSAVDFVRRVVRVAYLAGAAFVHVEWNDEILSLIKYQHAPKEAFKVFPNWKAKGFVEMAEQNFAFLSILGSNPDLLSEVDPAKITTQNLTDAEGMKDFREWIMNSRISWGLVSIPTPEWSAKIFPDLAPDKQQDALWESIFSVVRIDQPDPVKAWREHMANLEKQVKILDGKRFKKLHFKGPGTDLTVELPEKHLWQGGSSRNEKGVAYSPNIPTEEVFTMPHREGVNGTVRSTMPLIFRGTYISGLTMTFEKGKIVDFSAEEGYDVLKSLLDTDEGSRYLGEVALVPQDSPIARSGLLFYSTLFDENASCHLAFGSCYAPCLEGGKDMDHEELARHGANVSLVHVDFMIGSPELDIDGETPGGNREPLFRKGNWAK